MVSPEIYYLENHAGDTTSGQWATIDQTSDIEKIYVSICDVDIEPAGDFDVGLAGGCPRYVVFFLDNNAKKTIRFVDDKQVKIDGAVYNFCTGQSIYREIDAILEGYGYEEKTGG